MVTMVKHAQALLRLLAQRACWQPLLNQLAGQLCRTHIIAPDIALWAILLAANTDYITPAS